MEWLQSLLDSSTTPALTAFLLGLLTAISPWSSGDQYCRHRFYWKRHREPPQDISKRLALHAGTCHGLHALGIILILILEEGSSLFGIQKFIGKYGEMLLGPALLFIGLFMLFGHKFNLPSFGFKGNGEGLARRGGWGALLLGILFAMAFCPTSGVFYFGMLIPMSATSAGGYLLPVLFALATALPVLATAWILAFSVQHIGNFYGKIKTIQKWLNWIVGGLFTAIGLYYCLVINL